MTPDVTAVPAAAVPAAAVPAADVPAPGTAADVLALPLQRAPERVASPLHVVMCPPVHFEVAYAINPWMQVGVPLDRARALAEWEGVRDAYAALGHRVDVLTPVPGLPDQVFVANPGVVVKGRAYGARFRHEERRGEEQPYVDLLESLGVPVHRPQHVNEGEGDFLYLTDDLLLAGHGFRTTREAHAEAAEVLGVEVLSLELVDPRFYHLDVALMTLTEDVVALWPGAFTAEGLAAVRERVATVVEVSEADALAFGLNGVSDGRHVVLEEEAVGYRRQLEELGFVPVPVSTRELRKSGGSVKCCTQEVRGLAGPSAAVA